MFQYIGEHTSLRKYTARAVLSTFVVGIENNGFSTYTVQTSLPKDSHKQAGISIHISHPVYRTSELVPHSATVSAIGFEMGEEGPYKNVTFNDLLQAHSDCLQELRQGVVLKEDRLVAMLTGKEELEIRAQTGA